jgi:hypothetical protein
MSDRSIFQELSSSLNEKERNELLKKILKSLSLTNEIQEQVYAKQITLEDRNVKLSEELKLLDPITRFWYWLVSKVTGRSRRTILLNNKVKSLKNTIRHRAKNITGFETRNLTPEFANKIFELYMVSVPLKKLYTILWEQKNSFQVIFRHLLDLRIPDKISELEHLITKDEMIAIYDQTGAKTEIKVSIDARLREYIDSIPDMIYHEVEGSILPLYYLKDLVQFPFMSFFKLFHFTPDQDTDPDKLFFKNASAMVALEFLEKLYIALYSVQKIPHPIPINEDLMIYLAVLTDLQPTEMGKMPTTPEWENINIGEDLRDKADKIYKDMNTLVEMVKNRFKNFPLTEIIRYFRKDPYYQLIYYPPKLKLKDFYESSLRIKILKDFDLIFPTIRRAYIDGQIEKLFKGKKMINFLHYREYKSIDYQKLGLPFFTHTLSVKILFNYFRHFYFDWIQEAVQMIGRGILSQNRLTLERLLTYAAAVEDISDKIRAFDESLNPDAEDGKLFQKLRFSLAQDPTHQRMYRNLVMQKEKLVTSIIDRGVDSLQGIEKVFSEITTSPSPVIRTQLENHFIINGRPKNLRAILSSRLEHLKIFRELMYQIIKYEEN